MESIESHLSKVDLKLLTAFHVLMEERSVTNAASRMCLTQSAMSKTLQRLRDLFEDPLFVSSRQGLLPTPRAMELSLPMTTALSQLAATIFTAPFDPAQARGDINIQVHDAFSVAVIPALYARLRKYAKNLRLETDNNTSEHLDLLASGKSDFSIYIAQDYGSDFITYPLGTWPGVCWMRSGHPLHKVENLTMAEILTYPLVVLTYYDRQQKQVTARPVDHPASSFYQDYQLDKVASFKTSQLLTALTIVLESDTLMIGTPYLIKLRDSKQGLVTRPISDIRDSATSILIQHKRTEASPLHRWLREQIQQCWLQNK